MNRQGTQDAGMTLIELIIVLAVFALIATMSLQALSGTLRSRDHLVALERETADITRTLTLLRSDLSAAVPLLFHSPGGRSHSAVEILPGGQGFSLSLSGRIDLPGTSLAGLGRVVWRFERGTGILSRSSWPVLIPADGSAQPPTVVMVRDIISMEVRTLNADLRWQTGPNPNFRGSQSALPRAIDVILTSAKLSRISTVVSYP